MFIDLRGNDFIETRSGWEVTIASSESHSLPRTEMKLKQLLCKECIGDWRRNVCLKGVCDMFNDLRGNDFIETRSGWEVTIAGSESHSLPRTREMKQEEEVTKWINRSTNFLYTLPLSLCQR